MPAFWVAEHLDVVEDILPGLVARDVGFAPNTFTLYELEWASTALRSFSGTP
jgi:hypothetical protein